MRDGLHELVPAAVLQLGSMMVAVPTDSVVRIVAATELLRVPLAPRAVAGVGVFAGEPAPVVDLAELLGAARGSRSGTETVIVCRASAGPVALLGGRVRWVGRLRRASREVRCAAGTSGVEWRGTALPLLDPDLVLGAAGADDSSPAEWE